MSTLSNYPWTHLPHRTLLRLASLELLYRHRFALRETQLARIRSASTLRNVDPASSQWIMYLAPRPILHSFQQLCRSYTWRYDTPTRTAGQVSDASVYNHKFLYDILKKKK